MPTEETTTAQASGEGSPAPDQVAAAILATADQPPPPAESVRESPEYQSLQQAYRDLARQAGTSAAEARAARAQLDADRQAAEAKRVAEQAAAVTATLGQDRATILAEIADQWRTDPIGAARRFAEVTAAQSQPVTTPPPAVTPTQETTVPSPQVPSMSHVGLSASAPLGAAPAQTHDDQAQAHINEFEQAVALNANLQTRGRLGEKGRAAAIGNYLKGALMRDHGVDGSLVLGFDKER